MLFLRPLQQTPVEQQLKEVKARYKYRWEELLWLACQDDQACQALNGESYQATAQLEEKDLESILIRHESRRTSPLKRTYLTLNIIIK